MWIQRLADGLNGMLQDREGTRQGDFIDATVGQSFRGRHDTEMGVLKSAGGTQEYKIVGQDDGVEAAAMGGGDEIQGPGDSRSVDYEEALSASQVSARQWCILVICGLGNACDAIEALSMSYVLPVIELSTSEKALLSSTVFMGMLAGSVAAGFAADSCGRKPVLFASILLNAIFTVGFSLSTSIFALGTCRFFTGCGVGGAGPVAFALVSEIMPARVRGAAVSVVAAFWMLGSVAVALTAWSIIPRGGWRPFTAICSLPALSCAVATFFLAIESPRYLLLSGRDKAADDAFRRLTERDGAATTSRGGRRDVEVTLKPIEAPSVDDMQQSAYSQLAELASPALLRLTVVLGIVTACLGFGWYGLVMWMPSLFASRHVDLCISTHNTMDCTYQSALVATMSLLPGEIFSVVAMDRMSHQKLLASSGAIAAFAALLASLAVHPWQLGAAYCAFMACSACAWNALDVLYTESFPPSSRGTSIGLLTSIRQIAAILAQVVFASPAFAPPSSLPMFCSTVAMALSCACAMLLPGPISTVLPILQPAGQSPRRGPHGVDAALDVMAEVDGVGVDVDFGGEPDSNPPSRDSPGIFAAKIGPFIGPPSGQVSLRL
jgi:MFS family permease